MAHDQTYLGLDLGAESGRGMLARFDGERVRLDEVHRFPNVPVRLPTGLHWNILGLFADCHQAITKAARAADGPLSSLGIDAWGVDFGLLDRDGVLIGNPYHYRDERTDGMHQRAVARVSASEIYATTGVQFMPINTLNQLLAMDGSPALTNADRLLLIPDLLGYWFTGHAVAERTIASTTQLYDPERGEWAADLIARLGIPGHMFPALIDPGTTLGNLLPGIVETAGSNLIPLVAVGGHDTASAVAAVPATSPDFAYISSGTWSLVGVETRAPIRSPAALAANCTNEVGVDGTIRFLKNVMGLWLLQECRRAWARAGDAPTYDEVIALAATAPPFGPLIDPDHPVFQPPGDMPARIANVCRRAGQAPPDGPGALARCIFESLAFKYRLVLERIEAVTGHHARVIHIVGGGSRNALLCQLTANATNRMVLAGPVEATALGNVLTQARAAGELGSLAELREVVRRSFDLVAYEPTPDRAAWDDAYARFGTIIAAAAANEGA